MADVAGARRSRWRRRSSRCAARRTAGIAVAASSLEERCGVPLAEVAEACGGRPDHVPGHQVQPAARDRVARVVGHRRGGPRLRGVHHQRRAREAVAHALEADAPISTTPGCASWASRCPPIAHRSTTGSCSPEPGRSKGRTACRGHARSSRRTRSGPWLRVPGQSAHVRALPRGLRAVDAPRRREAIGVRDNEWVEAHNRDGILASRAVVSHRVPQGVCLMYTSAPARSAPALADRRAAGRDGERAHDDRDEADAHDRRLRAALVGAELLRPDGSNRDSVTIVRRRSQEVAY